MRKKQDFDMTICRDTKTLRRKRRRQRRRRRFLAILFVMMAILIPAGFCGFKFYQTHFNPKTVINGIDCSWLTAEEAFEKVTSSFQQTEICVKSDTADSYFSAAAIDLAFDDSTEEMLLQQKNNYQQEFTFSSFSFAEPKLKELLRNEIQAEKRSLPENAAVILMDDLLQIVPEKEGNFIPFPEAYEMTSNLLKTGNWLVDLTSLVISEPEITVADLEENVEEINAFLETSITFAISQDCSLTLDKSIMSKWLVSNNNGTYTLDIQANLPTFVEQLKAQCETIPVPVEFQGTDVGSFTVMAKKLPIDVETEMALIESELGSGRCYTHTPIYQPMSNSYVEIDLTRQHVWLYKDGVCLVDSDCVTGRPGRYATPEGYFFLTYKELNAVLRGQNANGSRYASPVAYWMPFNGNIGMHDATWQSSFGGTIYVTNGSHGCINLPKSAAKAIYENIDMSMPIIVYSS